MKSIFKISIGFFILTIISCVKMPIKKVENNINNQVINNIIYDFANKEKYKKNGTYQIIELEESDKLYCYMFVKPQFYSPRMSDTIEVTTASFPTRYLKFKKALFVWNDFEYPISQDLLKEYSKRNLIDSSLIKEEKGVISNRPLITTNEKTKAVFYYVCKDNPTRFIKLINNKVLNIIDYPVIDCKE